MANIDWDELAGEDSVPYVRFDTQSCVEFRFDRDIPYLPSLFPPNRADVDAYVREYYEARRVVPLLIRISLLMSKFPSLLLRYPLNW